MKKRYPKATLLFAALAASSAAVEAASVPVTGAMTYSQDFDAALANMSPAWGNDSLIPGWYAQINNGTTASGNVQVTDGSATLDGLLNCGTAGAPDRALGSKATGTIANIAYAVSFQNTSSNPIQWTALRYTGECWRSNSTAAGTTAEVWTTFYQKSPAVVTNIISGTSNATAAAGAGFTALGTTGNWTSPALSLMPVATAKDGNADGNFAPVSHTPATPVILQPGEFLTIKWTDSNLGGTDGFQAIDNVAVDFAQLDGSVVATPGFRTRDFKGTPTDLTDDTFGVSVSINGSGDVTSWTAPAVNPPAENASTGAYGTTAVWTGFPVTGPKSITVSDATNPAFSAALTVPPLAVIGSDDTVTPGTPILHEDVYFAGWAATDATRTLTQNATGTVNTDFVVNSEIIDLSAAGFVQFKAELEAITGTSSGFEAPDRFALQLIFDGGTPVSVLGTANDLNSDGYLTGAAAAAGDGVELPDANDINKTRHFFFSYIVPDTANTLQIRIIGNSNSAAETFRVFNVKLLPPPATILASLPGPSVLDNLGTASAADDQFSTSVTVTAVNIPGTPGWRSDLLPPAGPDIGTYSPPAVTFGPFPVSGGPKDVNLVDQLNPFASTRVTLPVPPAAALTATAPTGITRVANGPGAADDSVTFQTTITGISTGPFWNASGATLTPLSGPYAPVPVTITIRAPLPASPASVVLTDSSYPAATQTLSVPIPAIYTIGQRNFGFPLPVFSLPVSPPDTAWANDATARTLTMTDGDVVITGNKTVTSEVVDLSAISGAVLFSANLHVHDVTRGFEPADTFNAWLIYDGLAAAPVSLIGLHDRDGSGALTGDELCPVPAAPTGNFTQDFDYPLTAVIPDGVNNVQLVITGLNDSPNETMIVGNILIAPAPLTTDNDGDGISNADEALMGTDPNNAGSVLRLTQNAANPLQLDFPTVAGRFYRAYVSDDSNASSHLRIWHDAGLGTIAGDGNPAGFSITVTPGQARRFYRLHVQQSDVSWPATVP